MSHVREVVAVLLMLVAAAWSVSAQRGSDVMVCVMEQTLQY